MDWSLLITALSEVGKVALQTAGVISGNRTQVEVAKVQLEAIKTQADMERYLAALSKDLQKYLSDRSVDLNNIEAVKQQVLAYYSLKSQEIAARVGAVIVVSIIAGFVLIAAMKSKAKAKGI